MLSFLISSITLLILIFDTLLLKIFQLVVKENKWELDETIKVSFFKKHYDNFKFYGRDMELLFTKCKRAHSQRIFADSTAIRKRITTADINIAIKSFILKRMKSN